MDDLLFEEYQNLLLERDARKKDAEEYHAYYVKEFGDLINAVFDKKRDYVKKKKGVTFCKLCSERGMDIDVNELNRFIQEEMDAYDKKHDGKIDDLEACKNADESSKEAAAKAKSVYRRIAKLIHPDMHPEIEGIEKLRVFWIRVTEAYRKNDVKALRELEVLIYGILEDYALVNTHPEIEDIEEKIEQVKAEIDIILTTDPYLYCRLLSDEKAMKEKREQLESKLAEYTQKEKDMDEKLTEIMKNATV